MQAGLGSQIVHFSAIWGHFTMYFNTPTPIPLKVFSHQIYTDLKNGPGSWKKV